MSMYLKLEQFQLNHDDSDNYYELINAPILQEVSYMGAVSGSYFVADNSTCEGCGCKGSTCFKYNFYTARGGERQQLIIHTNKKSKEVKRNVIDFAKYFGIYDESQEIT